MYFTFQFVRPFCSSVHRFVYPSISLFIRLSVRLSVCLLVHPSIYSSIRLTVRQSVHLFGRLPSVRQSVHLFVVGLFIRLSVCSFVHPSVYSSVRLTSRQSVHLFVRLSACPSSLTHSNCSSIRCQKKCVIYTTGCDQISCYQIFLNFLQIFFLNFFTTFQTLFSYFFSHFFFFYLQFHLIHIPNFKVLSSFKVQNENVS